jgi:hypothetical protein
MSGQNGPSGSKSARCRCSHRVDLATIARHRGMTAGLGFPGSWEASRQRRPTRLQVAGRSRPVTRNGRLPVAGLVRLWSKGAPRALRRKLRFVIHQLKYMATSGRPGGLIRFVPDRYTRRPRTRAPNVHRADDNAQCCAKVNEPVRVLPRRVLEGLARYECVARPHAWPAV